VGFGLQSQAPNEKVEARGGQGGCWVAHQ
jgi:hypothetical protein